MENNQCHGHRSRSCSVLYGHSAGQRPSDGHEAKDLCDSSFWSSLSVSLPSLKVDAAANLKASIIAAIVLRIHYLETLSTSDNPTLAAVFFVIWTLVEVDFSIVSGNIACLKPFMAAFNTSYGGVEEINAVSRRERGDKSGSGTVNSMKMSKFSRSRKEPDTPKESTRRVSVPQARADTLGHEAEITHEDAESVGSHGSRQMIIQKEITWNVEYHTPNPVKKGPSANPQYNV